VKKVIFQMSVSVDGYVEGPNQELDWHNVDDEFNAYAAETLKKSEVLIMGRKTYELMASYWPTSTDNDPDVTFQMNETPKLVFSRTLKHLEWKTARLATGSIAEEVARLKSAPGDGLMWVGGSELASAFLEEGLLDEIRVILTPMLLGSGHAVFGDIKRRHELKRVSTKSFASGNLLVIYEPVSR
jgi:dihydrofolate reductase